MREKRKIIFGLVYLAVSALIVLGVITMLGWFTKPEVHVFVHDFEFEEELAYLELRFESSSGVFVTGEKIDVNAFLGYSFDTSSTSFHLLYFPDALEPEEYQELIPKENFGKIIPDEDGSGFSFKAAPSKILHNLGNFPPTSEFDVIWTQDGPKDAVLLMDAKTISFSKEQLLKDGMIIEKMITIQPSYVKLQMQSNNVSMGLVVIIIGITLLTAFFGVEKIWFLPKSDPASSNRDDSKRKK